MKQAVLTVEFRLIARGLFLDQCTENALVGASMDQPLRMVLHLVLDRAPHVALQYCSAHQDEHDRVPAQPAPLVIFTLGGSICLKDANSFLKHLAGWILSINTPQW